MATQGQQQPESHFHRMEHLAWAHVQHSPLASMWDLHGIPIKQIASSTWNSLNDDSVFGRASQLAYAFFSALFPALIAISSAMGLIAQSSNDIYFNVLGQIGRLIPPAAYSLVIETFKQTTKASSSTKIVLGITVAIFSASVGISALQDTLNTVYKLKETRSFWKARAEAMGLTVFIALVILGAILLLLGGDFSANHVAHLFRGSLSLAILIRLLAWFGSSLMMIISFELLYYFCPNSQKRTWRWFTPGGLVGLLGWILGSICLRIYLHYFNNYSMTYGSLGAVVILLLWFYLTGVMILLGGEVNSEIERAVAQHKLSTGAATPPPASAIEQINMS